MTSLNYLTASPKQGVELLIVPVDEYSYDHEVSEDEGINFLSMFLPAKGFENDPANAKRLPTGSYTFLFCSNNANEEQARGIVASQMERGAVFNPEVGHYQSAGWTTYYRNYEHYPATSICIPNTALESLQSLLRSLGLDPSLNYAILKIN